MLIKSIRLALLCIFINLAFSSGAQSITIPGWIRLPADSVLQKTLISSLNAFLAQKEKPNKDNTYVLKDALPETSALLDEMKGMEQNEVLKDDNYYKSYLTNIIELDADNFIVQLSYIGINHTTPILRASFTLMAKKVGDVFNFYSPLKQNTLTWKAKKFGNLTCYYKTDFDPDKAKAYQKMVYFYDKKLNIPDGPIDFYYCSSFTEVLHLEGVEYKAAYNGQKNNSLSSYENNSNLIVNGEIDNGFDPHDLFHDRLAIVMKNANRPVNEGCAYLYGGSWGYSWETVLAKFKKYAADNPNADWLNLYISTANYEDGDKPMKVAYALNALIVQKIEREQGFGKVMELLGCGPRQKGDDNYFAALKKITGIDKDNFNAKMRELIDDSKTK
jgi:hypothetical protein